MATDTAPPAAPTAPTSLPAPASDSFMRDPHKLIAYIVPFPAPNPSSSSTPTPPLRFVLYTPPPPPLLKPSEGKERTSAKVQRKWEEEVRAAHTTSAGTFSFSGLRARVTRGVHWAVGQTTTADLDFLTRIPRDGGVAAGHRHDVEKEEKREGEKAEKAAKGEKAEKAAKGEKAEKAAKGEKDVGGDNDSGNVEKMDKVDPAKEASDLMPTALDSDSSSDSDAEDAKQPADPSHSHDDLCRTVKLDSMVLLYPPNMKMTEDELRTEFINSLMRTKSKAQRDAVIATGLLPVTAVLDWALVFVGWVFGGALEVDAIWMANSLRGAKTARSVTRRLASTEEAINLQFVASDRAAVLEAYLLGACIARNRARFDRPHWGIPTESDVMTTIGWQASSSYETKNWEDESWERSQVVSDLQVTFRKAARGWDKWVNRFVKNPEKALSK